MSRLTEIKQKIESLPGGPTAIRLFQRIKRDRATGLAAQTAYHLIFSLPPLLLVLVALAAVTQHFTSVPMTDDLRKVIDQHAPGSAKPLLDSIVQKAVGQTTGSGASIGVIVGIIIAVWSAGNGVGSLMYAFNQTYEVDDERSFVSRKLTTLGLTLLTGILVIVAFVLFVFGQRIGLWIADRVGLGGAFTFAWNVLRWPVAIVLVLVVLAALYYFGPDVDQSFRWVTAGSALAATLWVLAILGFKLYLAVSNPGSAYGAAGGVIVLLFFLYITALVFIIGAELNAVLELHHDPKTQADVAQDRKKSSGQGDRTAGATSSAAVSDGSDRRQAPAPARKRRHHV